MKSSCLTFLILITSAVALAQTPYLVDDINTTTNAYPASSLPKNFVRFGSRIYFAAQTFSGTELWSTDGTAVGTAQVADINPGFNSSSPSHFAVVNGVLLFNASDGTHGEELWTTDGTQAGTRLFADINSGFRASSPGDRIVYHGKMLFAADDGVDGSELWVTDGTPAGTHFLKDLVPGSGSSSPRAFVIFNDQVYFGASNGLWKSDGTADGTVQVKGGLSVGEITIAGSWMFLAGSSGSGTQPWASDGTEAGTHVLTNPAPGFQGPTYQNSTVAFRGGVLFVAFDTQHGDELWYSDGTSAGTRLVADLDGSSNSSLYGGPFGIIGDKAYFLARTPGTGSELWETDGTAAGTRVLDIVPGTDGSNPISLLTVGSRVFFIAYVNSEGGLWVTDGTVGGTRRIRSADLSVAPSLNALTNIDGVVYFAGANALNGSELWKSDGTDGGTSMIANIAVDSAPSSAPADLTAAGDWVYFDAWDGSGSTANGGTPRSLWRSDGTAAGTVKLADSPTWPYLAAGHTLLFNLEQNTPWISDGTLKGTGPATELVSRFSTRPFGFYAVGDTLLAQTSDPAYNGDLWATKVSTGSPVVHLAAVVVSNFVPIANRVMFFGHLNSISPPAGLWITDGTPAGTHPIVPNFGTDSPGSAAVWRGYLYFATSSPSGAKLWKSEGTFEGTTVVKTLPGQISNLTAAGSNLFFTNGNQLWASDGTDAGTRSLNVTAQTPFAVTGGRVVFSSPSSSLWVSDGTTAGTHALHNSSGAEASFAGELTAAGGVVYFSGTDPQHSQELWSTDGTDAGTKMAADIEPGTAGSYPKTFVPAGEHLFFTANTTATGNELWALTLPLRLSISDVFAGESQPSATLTVTLSRASSQTVTVSYATSDGSAIAGKDYDAVSGALTFAPGETTKSIAVPLHGNSTPENNRTFLVTLANASGAAIVKPAGFAIIEDDDAAADVALSADFSKLNFSSIFVKATNHGPEVATGLKITHTVTPSSADPTSCSFCPPLVLQLAPGETETALEFNEPGLQYYTATLSADQHDPDPSNNSVAFVRSGGIGMDALYLTPGADANIWFSLISSDATTIESSNPGVVSVPSGLPALAMPTFVAHGVSVGTATIRVTHQGQQQPFALDVNVVAPGTKVRWPGGITAYGDNTIFPIDRPNPVRVYATGTAPYTGETATGTLVVSENGQELGRMTIGPDGTRTVGQFGTTLPVYVTQLGQQNLTISYSGDANFLPTTTTSSVWSEKGNVTIAATAETTGSSVTLHLRLTGSPFFAPGGTVTVSEPGVVAGVPAALSDGRADVTMNNLSGGRHVFAISYSGDSIYNPGSQNVPATVGKHRAAGH